jgi:hypothetical protein
MDKVCSTHGAKRNACRISVGILKERDHYEDLGAGGRVILIWISYNYDGTVQTGLI